MCLGSKIAECYEKSAISAGKWEDAKKLVSLLKQSVSKFGKDDFKLELSGSIVYGCMLDEEDIKFNVEYAGSDSIPIKLFHKIIFIKANDFLAENECKLVYCDGLVNASSQDALSYGFEIGSKQPENESTKLSVVFNFNKEVNVDAMLSVLKQEDYFRILSVSLNKMLIQRGLSGSNKEQLSSTALAVLIACYYAKQSKQKTFRNRLKKSKDSNVADSPIHRKAPTRDNAPYAEEMLGFVEFVLNWKTDEDAFLLDDRGLTTIRREQAQSKCKLDIRAFGSNNLAEKTPAIDYVAIKIFFRTLKFILSNKDSELYEKIFESKL